MPQTWFGRLVWTAASLAFLALALLFFSFFVILIIALIPILMIRAAWLSRFSRPRTGSDIIDVQYTVKTQDPADSKIMGEISDDADRPFGNR